MALRLMERLKNIFESNLSDLIDETGSASSIEQIRASKLSLEDQLRAELGAAIAERYRLQKMLAELPDFEGRYLIAAEKAVDAGHDQQARIVLREKLKAEAAVTELKTEIADLEYDIQSLEDLLSDISEHNLSSETLVQRLGTLSSIKETQENKS